jgi:hypothetical protein
MIIVYFSSPSEQTRQISVDGCIEILRLLKAFRLSDKVSYRSGVECSLPGSTAVPLFPQVRLSCSLSERVLCGKVQNVCRRGFVSEVRILGE